ncbi:MAG TPA: hypothetical protein PLI34_03390 [Saprospiraceae bacterium]|nr:hypothetical protein [Saprospiraceae bacterium]
MQKVKLHWFIRRTHRFMGVILGLQFLAWTLGGLYFSWTRIENIRGENLRKEAALIPVSDSLAPLGEMLRSLSRTDSFGGISAVSLIEILGETHYQIQYQAGSKKKVRLVHAGTGQWRSPLSEKEAVSLAQSRLLNPGPVESVAYLQATGSHHEYREKPLPAYAVRFGAPSRATVYVAAEWGTVQSFRNDQWRIFDFLWMLHTMDYQGRDDFNNALLRAFSVFGLMTIFSGFALFFISQKHTKHS